MPKPARCLWCREPLAKWFLKYCSRPKLCRDYAYRKRKGVKVKRPKPIPLESTPPSGDILPEFLAKIQSLNPVEPQSINAPQTGLPWQLEDLALSRRHREGRNKTVPAFLKTVIASKKPKPEAPA